MRYGKKDPGAEALRVVRKLTFATNHGTLKWRPVGRGNCRGYATRWPVDECYRTVSVRLVSHASLRLRMGAQFFMGDTDGGNPLGKLWRAIRKNCAVARKER